jgi:BASS family bile acid:Na+ symporter
VLAAVVVADAVLVPLLAWAVVNALPLGEDAATGLLLVGVASAGPLGLKLTELAGLDVRSALCFVVALDIANLVAIPVWAALLLPAGATLRPLTVVVTLVGLVLAPLAVGSLARGRLERRADVLARRLRTASTAGLLLVIVAAIVHDGEALREAASPTVIGSTLAISGGAFALGWLAGGRDRGTRGAAAFVTATRANALALAIAEASFPERPAVRATVVVFAVTSILLTTGVATAVGRGLLGGRLAGARAPAAEVGLRHPVGAMRPRDGS